MTQDTWWDKPLDQMSHEEWEALCDGCGRCCMHKFIDEDTGEMLYTDVACRLFIGKTCRCRDYANRAEIVPECLTLTVELPEAFDWLPPTCAYRLLFEGKELPEWHPLISGTPDSVIKAGISMRGLSVPEEQVDDKEISEHIVEWTDWQIDE